jgi:hypothetical protein
LAPWEWLRKLELIVFCLKDIFPILNSLTE